MGTHPIFESDFDCLTDSMTLQDMSDNSSSVNGSDMSSGEFDSDAESRVSSVLTESLAEEEAQPIVENESRAPGEVDLSAFNDLCRKILAKKIPDGYKTGILCRVKHSSAAERRTLEKERKKKKKAEGKLKKNWENLARQKPDVKTASHDRQLENIAKRGVVDFFNAIEKHQNELKRKLEQAGPTELRRSKVIKSTKEKDITEKITEQQEKSSNWSALSKENSAMVYEEPED